MKILFLIISIFLLSSPTWSETLTIDDLVERNETYYKKFSDIPFTGEISGKANGKFKKGKREGLWISYHDNGQLFIKTNFKNGKHEGSYISYYSDGTLWVKTTMKNGKEHGISEYYYSREFGGRPQWKGHKKNGERDGDWIGWHENGQLHFKGKYINGKEEGEWVVYLEDGSLSKKGSGFFRNGVKQ